MIYNQVTIHIHDHLAINSPGAGTQENKSITLNYNNDRSNYTLFGVSIEYQNVQEMNLNI